MKTKPYEKPISAELAALIKKAIAYTKEKYGDTTYIFVDEKNPSRPMPYTTVQFRITDMIIRKNCGMTTVRSSASGPISTGTTMG